MFEILCQNLLGLLNIIGIIGFDQFFEEIIINSSVTIMPFKAFFGDFMREVYIINIGNADIKGFFEPTKSHFDDC